MAIANVGLPAASQHSHSANTAAAVIPSSIFTSGYVFFLCPSNVTVGAGPAESVTTITWGWSSVTSVAQPSTHISLQALFVKDGDGSTSVTTITYPHGQSSIDFNLTAFSGTKSVAGGAVVQSAISVLASGNTAGVSLTTFADAVNNATLLWTYNGNAGVGLTNTKSGYTGLGLEFTNLILKPAWKSSQDTNSYMTGTTAFQWTAIGLELANAAGTNWNVTSQDTATATDTALITDIYGPYQSAENVVATDAYAYSWQQGPNWPTGGGGWHKWHQQRPGGGRPGSPRRPF